MAQRVVVVGGGFAGVLAVRGLRRADVEVTLVDRQNFYLFQPLAYQVATGSLSAEEVAVPLRQIVRRQKHTRVILAEVTGFDLAARHVILDHLPNGARGVELPYDTLIVAGGSRYSYFGHDDWAAHAPELKSLAGAIDLRDRILLAFEAAETEPDQAAREAWLTFVVVGAGPTGVEMAGQIAELGHTLRREYRAVDTSKARVLLVEATDRVLGAFPDPLPRKAEAQLISLGVTPMLGTTVVDIDATSVEVQTADGSRTRIPARTAVWAAGVTASPLAGLLAEAIGAETDRAGRITVEPDLTVAGHPEVFALGDMVSVRGQQLHGVAPVAMQQGRHAARSISRGTHTAFRYRDKGELATIGHVRAVGVVKGLKLSGFLAWALWLGIHITYLIGFQNRLIVLTRWTFSYFTRGRGARVIHGS
ncbi:MAG TPA: NAD(P)/FAD-dependent oxidoreductase [Gaiellaceae bacterium]|jgi:NADH dehydrogenase|nr:NAD(P)/FAD-dependent oxidoreductase [Gaiellaceae bacterium]